MRVDDARSRRATLAVLAGLAVAGLSALLAGAAGGPYLSLERLSPWLVAYAIGLFAALFAAPFAIHARVSGELEDDARWERSLLWWGAVAIAALALGLLLGLPSGFAADSLAGSLGVVTVVEATLVLGTLAALLLSG